MYQYVTAISLLETLNAVAEAEHAGAARDERWAGELCRALRDLGQPGWADLVESYIGQGCVRAIRTDEEELADLLAAIRRWQRGCRQ